MSTGIVFVHGRAQEMRRVADRRDATRVAAHVASRKQAWLAGLSKGLVLARRAPIPPENVYFPFYGNDLADGIAAHLAAGRPAPDLESFPAGSATADQLLLEAAAQLGYEPEREIGYTDPATAARVPSEELAWTDALRVPVVSSALKFLARKTGIPEWIIQERLADVAYYLEVPSIRKQVLDDVLEAVTTASARHDDLVLVSHSLGTVVAYDLFSRLAAGTRVRLLVTAGSPLGYPIVRKNLLEPGDPGDLPPVPPGVPWVNAYDVRDVVALVHPLAPCFRGGATGIRDEVTHNPSEPHSIADYLSDPDVAGPIGDVVSR